MVIIFEYFAKGWFSILFFYFNNMDNNKTLKPYLIDAFYKWALAHNTTPLIEVVEDYYNQLPLHIKKQNLIVLNIHPDATHGLTMGKSFIEFEAIFNGDNFKVQISYDSVQKIFIKEDGYGLEFTVEQEKIKHPYRTERKAPLEKRHLKLVKNN